MIGLLQFHITACADQLLYNLSLIKLCPACAKQNAAVKIASDTCSLLVKETLSDLVVQLPRSLVINFEQHTKSFLV